MLKKLRKKKTAKKIWIVLAILILPAFVLWGSGSVTRSKQEGALAGRIFGRNISALEYQDALSAVRNTAIMQYGDKFTEIQKQLNLEQQAWERLVMLHEARRRRIAVSDKEVIELIDSYLFFQRNGRFDQGIYNEMLQYVFRAQPRIFEEETRQNIALSKLYRQVTKDVKASDQEIRSEYRKFNEEVSVSYIESLPSDFAKSIAPTQEELKEYFSKNSLEFKQPLSFNIEYIALDSEDKLKDAFISLKKKDDFEKVAKDMGTALKESGLFGQTDPIPGIGWSPDMINLIAKLKVGQYSIPIYADKKFYILKLKGKLEPFIPEFEKVKDKVKEKFIRNKSEALAKAGIDEALKKLIELNSRNPKALDLEKAARESGLKSNSTGLFKSGTYIEGIGASDILWSKASELKDGAFSGVIEIPTGYYIIKVKSRVPMDEKKFESQKQEFSKGLLEQKQQEYFAQFMQSLLKKAQ